MGAPRTGPPEGAAGMGHVEDLSDRALVLTASEARWRDVLRPALRMASLPDGRPVEPEWVRPHAFADASALRPLDLLEYGALAVVDLEEIGRPLFSLLAWHGRARPRSVILLRPGSVALPYELHEFAVASLAAEDPDAAAESRLAIATRAARGAQERAVLVPGGEPWTSEPGNLRERRRRAKSGLEGLLRHADLSMLSHDVSAAMRAMQAARDADPGAADVLLRLALLLREAGRWPDARVALEAAVQAHPACGAAWRELGIVRDRAGEEGAEEALRRAVETSSDYGALVALAGLVGRTGNRDEALRLLDRAIEEGGGQLNLVLPAATLRGARDRRAALAGRERERVEQVFAIRRSQAEAVPSEDAPWSHFDAIVAALLLGERDAALALADAVPHRVKAAWETEPFADSLSQLEDAGIDVAEVRRRTGARPRKAAVSTSSTPRPERRPPFPAVAREPGWYRENVPCASACPVGTDAGAYVRLLAEGRFADAFDAARGPNPFASVCGRVCAAPCEEACRRGRIDEPVAIRPLKRFLTERHGSESAASRLDVVLGGARAPCMEGDAYVSHLKKLAAASGGGRRVAVVGGGPSGLACAHDLAFLGYRVTLLEASGKLGGMMRHGIPEYRLPRDVLDGEIEAILRLGVDVRLDAGLDAERTLASLLAEGYEAAFLASGASRGKGLDVEGAGLDGVVRAIDFLINVNNGFRVDLGARVVVQGGGNVAMDVARTVRLGRPPSLRGTAEAGEGRDLAPSLKSDALRGVVAGFTGREVHVVARQPMGQWPAQKSVHGREEVEEAQREGVVLHPLRGIRRILGREGRVTGVELAEVVRLVDERGRYAPLYGSHRAEEIPCDTVILAVGQEPDLDYLEGCAALRRTREGYIEVDPATLATSLPGVYAGGDAAFGPRTLIEAVGEGKRAARSIHAHLSGGRRLEPSYTLTWVPPRGIWAREDYDALERRDPGAQAVERRTGIAEVESCYDEAEALRQASRCLTCHVQTVYDGSLCIACGHCTEACPHACLAFVAPGDATVEGLEPAALAAAHGAGETVFLVKDEDRCVRCGLCAERCPTGAMTMERFDMAVSGRSA